MNQIVENFEQQRVLLPITEAAYRTANQFSQNHPSLKKREAVRLNTLAICVANNYFQMMGISTQPENSDSWHPVMQMMADVADLYLPEIGHLECRPIYGNASVCQIPPEVWDLRVGYLVIALDEDLKMAQLLGFVPSVEDEELPLNRLQPLEDLLDHLYAVRQANILSAPETPPETNPLSEAVVNLGQWMNNTFEAGWQAVEALLSPQTLTPAFSFRGQGDDVPTPDSSSSPVDVRRAKLVDLTVQLGAQAVVLVLELRQDNPSQVDIGLQVHPAGDQPYLSPGVELAVLDASREVFMQAQSRQADNYIQLQFSGQSGESFQVQIQLGEAQYLESFVI